MNWLIAILILLLIVLSIYSYKELRTADRQNWREEFFFWSVILFPWAFFLWAIADLAWDSARRFFRRRIYPRLRRWFCQIRRAHK